MVALAFKLKAQRSGMEKQASKTNLGCQRGRVGALILNITQYRVTNVATVHSDLVGSTRDRLGLNKCGLLPASDNPEAGQRCLTITGYLDHALSRPEGKFFQWGLDLLEMRRPAPLH